MIYGRYYSTAISSIIPYHLSPLLVIALIGSLPFSGSQKKNFVIRAITRCHGLFLLFCVVVLSFNALMDSIHCRCLFGFCCSLSIRGMLKYRFILSFYSIFLLFVEFYYIFMIFFSLAACFMEF